MDILWDREEYAYIAKEKLSNGQTLFMMFQELEDTKLDYLNYNVVVGVYTKRKSAGYNEENALITGHSPWESAIKGIKMFDEMEKHVIQEAQEEGKGINIYVHWVNNRRRDAYYKVLSKRGYSYCMFEGIKHLVKRIPPPTYACI